jgi:hypothetical protein
MSEFIAIGDVQGFLVIDHEGSLDFLLRLVFFVQRPDRVEQQRCPFGVVLTKSTPVFVGRKTFGRSTAYKLVRTMWATLNLI